LQTKGSSKDIGECLKRISEEHRNLLQHLTSFSKSLDADLIGKVQRKDAALRKDVKCLDQAHWKEMKNMRVLIKSKKSELKKLNKKVKRDQNLQKTKLRDQTNNELQTMKMVLEEQERQALRRIVLAERSFFSKFAFGLQQVVAEEMKIFGHSINISQEVLKLEEITKNTDSLPSSAETFINELVSSGKGFIFITPPSSPRGSLLRSWGGSVMSIASLMDVSPSSPREKRQSRKKERSNRLLDITEREDFVEEVNNDESKRMDILRLDVKKEPESEKIEEEEYFTRRSSKSSGYGSSSAKSDNSDDEVRGLNFPLNDTTYLAPTRSSSVMSSFRAPVGNRVRTFSENMEDNDDSSRLRTNYHLARSSSFGGQHRPTAAVIPRVDQVYAQTMKPRRNSDIVTNLQDHLRMLDKQKDSIMNLLDNDYWIE